VLLAKGGEQSSFDSRGRSVEVVLRGQQAQGRGELFGFPQQGVAGAARFGVGERADHSVVGGGIFSG
jgi:hypothetical protein